MSFKKVVAVFLVFCSTLFISDRGLACDCAGFPSPFSITARGASLVARGYAHPVDADSIDFEIVEVLRGQEDRPIVRISTNGISSCELFPSEFEPFDTAEWLVALYSTPEESYAKLTRNIDYFSSDCSESLLSVVDGNVLGFINRKTYEDILGIRYSNVCELAIDIPFKEVSPKTLEIIEICNQSLLPYDYSVEEVQREISDCS